jgi:hypothetical protein
MKELRESKRVPFSAQIEQLVVHASDYPRLGADDEFLEAKALNISSGGIACESRTTIDPLSRVYFIFSVPTPGGSRRIRSDGYVAHATSEGGRYVLGLRFVDLSPEDQAAIDAYIDSAG